MKVRSLTGSCAVGHLLAYNLWCFSGQSCGVMIGIYSQCFQMGSEDVSLAVLKQLGRSFYFAVLTALSGRVVVVFNRDPCF